MRDEVWQALEDWGWPHNGRFFPGCSDKRPSVLVGRVLRQVGAPEWVSFHSCRHRYATALYRQGGDLRIVQDMLGHSSLQTTAMYLQVMPEAAASAVRAMPGLVA
jgi:site-specific recombinase XerD